MKLAHRVEFNGLRAIAIIAVIFYHSKFAIHGYGPLSGGYVGVDIFFVISGYLITQIILKEQFTRSKFQLLIFYKKRIRRILPALIFVIIIFFPIAYQYLLPDDFIDFSKSILYSLLFISNLYFHFSGLDYGAQNNLFVPFLHLWSLSIEGQFYLVFPIILLIIFRKFKKNSIYFLFILLIISFFLGIQLAINEKTGGGGVVLLFFNKVMGILSRLHISIF